VFPVKSQKCDFGAELRCRIIATSAGKGLRIGQYTCIRCTNARKQINFSSLLKLKSSAINGEKIDANGNCIAYNGLNSPDGNATSVVVVFFFIQDLVIGTALWTKLFVLFCFFDNLSSLEY
jgi:hypothetical protein